MTSVRTELAQLRGLAVDAGFGAGWGAVKALPEPVANRAFRAAADLAVRRDGAGVRQLRNNLRRVVGATITEDALNALVITSMHRYARYWLETFRLPKLDHARRCRGRQSQHLRRRAPRCRRRGRPGLRARTAAHG